MEFCALIIAAIVVAAFGGPTWAWATLVALAALAVVASLAGD